MTLLGISPHHHYLLYIYTTQILCHIYREREGNIVVSYQSKTTQEVDIYHEQAASVELRRQRVSRYNKQYYLTNIKDDPVRTARRRQSSKAANERKRAARHKHAVVGGRQGAVSLTLFGST